MPVRTVGDQRWEHVGETVAGNRIFRRSGMGIDALSREALQLRLEKRGLSKSGSKDELAARLTEAG